MGRIYSTSISMISLLLTIILYLALHTNTNTYYANIHSHSSISSTSTIDGNTDNIYSNCGGIIGVEAVNIGYVTAPSQTTDTWLSDLIASMGHTVTRLTTSQVGGVLNLQQTQINLANSFDLLVISRTAVSNQLVQNQWNTNILRPILILNNQLLYVAQWGMVSTSADAAGAIGLITALNSTGQPTNAHSLWYNVPLTLNANKNYTVNVTSAAELELPTVVTGNNGQLIGVATTPSVPAYNGAVWLMKWSANTTYHSATTKFGLADRLFYGSADTSVPANANSYSQAGIQLLRNCIDHLTRGTITVSPSSIDVENSGGFNGTFTLTLSSAPRRAVILRMIPPSSVSIIGGNDITIAAGITSINISVTGGTSTSQSQLITWLGAYSSDPYWDTAGAGSISVRVIGKLRASPTSITTQISGAGGFTGSFILTATPAPTNNVTIVITPPSSYTIAGGNTVTLIGGTNTVTVTLIGGASPSLAQALSFAYSSSTDPYFDHILTIPSVQANVVGQISTAWALDVQILGGTTTSLTYTANPAPSSDILIMLASSPSYTIVEGVNITIAAGTTSTTVTVRGGASPLTTPITCIGVISNDVAFSGVLPTQTPSLTILGIISSTQSSLTVQTTGGATSNITLTASSIATSSVYITVIPPSTVTIFGGNTQILHAGQRVLNIIVIGGTSPSLASSLSFAMASSSDPQFNRTIISSIMVDVVGVITPSLTSTVVQVLGALTSTFTLSLGPIAPTSDVNITIIPPSSVTIVGGVNKIVSAGSTSVDVTIIGGSVLDLSTSIRFAASSSVDHTYNMVVPSPSIALRVAPLLRVSTTNLTVAVNGDATFAVTISPAPTTNEVSVICSPPLGVSLTGAEADRVGPAPSVGTYYIKFPASSSVGYTGPTTTVIVRGTSNPQLPQVMGFAESSSQDLSYMGIVPSPPLRLRVSGSLISTVTSLKVPIAGGLNASFTLTLNPTPTADVIFTIVPPTGVSVTGGNTRTITAGSSSYTIELFGGPSPSLASSLVFNLTSSSDPFYDTVQISPLSVGVVGTLLTSISASSSLLVTKSGMVYLNITANPAPAAIVSVSMTLPSYVTSGLGSNVISWNINERVKMIPINGATISTGESITFGTASSDDPFFSGVQISSVPVTVTGTLTPSSSSLIISKGSNYTLTLTASPTVAADVTIVITPPSSVTIVGGNTITIPQGQSSVDILIHAGDVPSTSDWLTFASSSSTDYQFNGIQISAVPLRVAGAITVSAAASPLVVGAGTGGITGVITFTCSPLPTNDVTITLTPPSSVTIASGNTLTIPASLGVANITIVGGSAPAVQAFLTYSTSSSNDINFSGVTSTPSWPIKVVGTLTASSSSFAVAIGATGTFVISSSTPVTADVTITVHVPASVSINGVSGGTTTITIPSGQSSVSIVVTGGATPVTGGVITFDPSTSSDSNFDGASLSSINLAVTGSIVSSALSSLDAQVGITKIVSITVSPAPTADITIPITSIPSSITLGGSSVVSNSIAIPAGATSVSFTVTGGSSTASSQVLTFGTAVSTDINFAGVQLTNIAVTVKGVISVSASAISIPTLGSYTLLVSANPAPTSAVIITVVGSQWVTVSPNPVVLLSTTPVSLTVTAFNNINDSSLITFASSQSSDNFYSGVATPSVAVTVRGRITVSPASLTVAVAGRAATSFSFVLDPVSISPVTILITPPSGVNITSGNLITIPAGVASYQVFVAGADNQTHTAATITFGMASSLYYAYSNASVTGSVSVTVVDKGLITLATSIASPLLVAVQGGANSTLTFDLFPAPTSSLTTIWSPPSSIAMVGGNTRVIAAGTTSYTMYIYGTSSAPIGSAESLTLQSITTDDPYFASTTVTVPVQVVSFGSVSLSTSLLQVAVGGAYASLTVSITPAPTSSVTLSLSPACSGVSQPFTSLDIVIAAGGSSATGRVSVAAGATPATCSAAFSAMVSNDVRYSGVVLSSSLLTIDVIALGTISAPSSVDVAPNDRASQTVTLTLSQVATSWVNITVTVPTNVTLVGTNIVAIPAGSLTGTFTIRGGASSSVQSIVFGSAASSDPRFAGIQVTALPVTVVTLGTISVLTPQLSVAVFGGATALLTLSLSPTPVKDVIIPVSAINSALSFDPPYIVINASSATGSTTVHGGTSATSASVIFGAAVTAEPRYVGEVPSSSVSVAVVNQGVVTISTNNTISVEKSGGDSTNITLYFTPVPTSSMSITFVPPSTIYIVGGNTKAVVAGTPSLTITLQGGTTIAAAQPLTVQPIVTTDAVYSGVVPSFSGVLTIAVVAIVELPLEQTVAATYVQLVFDKSPDVVFANLAALESFSADIITDFNLLLGIRQTRFAVISNLASYSNSKVTTQVAITPDPNDATNTPDVYMAQFIYLYSSWYNATVSSSTNANNNNNNNGVSFTTMDTSAITLQFQATNQLRYLDRPLTGRIATTGHITLVRCTDVYRIACETEESWSTKYLAAGLSITFVFLFVVIVIFIVLCVRHRKKQKLAREQAAINRSTRNMTAIVTTNGNGANGTASVSAAGGKPSNSSGAGAVSSGHHQRASISEPGRAISPMSIQANVTASRPSTANGNGKRRSPPATPASPLLRTDDAKRQPIDSSSMV